MVGRLGNIADELYGLPPSGFIAARAAQLAALRDEPDFAVQVRHLRRPAPAAWIVNLLVRERRTELEDAFELGAQLRVAQETLERDQIRRLSRERRAALAALTEAGEDLALAAGFEPSPTVLAAVHSTLDAGLADPGAADAIRTGRLVRALETIGFDPADLAEAVALPEAGSRAAQKRERLKPVPPRVDDADAALRRARERADRAVNRAEAAANTAAAQLERVEARVGELRTALAAAQKELDTAEQAREAATDSHEKARSALDVAWTKRRELG